MSDLTHLFEQRAQQSGELGTDDAMLSLRQLIDAADEAETELAAAKAAVATLERRLEKLCGDAIPTAMQLAGVKKFTRPDGSTVDVQDLVNGTLGQGKDEAPGAHEARRREAFEWLRASGNAGVIKQTFEIPLPRHTPADTVERIRKTLVQNGIPFDAVEDVHHSTLRSLLGELVEQHKGVLPESIARLFRVTQFRRAKIQRPKSRK